jgi:hypothetical protein
MIVEVTIPGEGYLLIGVTSIAFGYHHFPAIGHVLYALFSS